MGPSEWDGTMNVLTFLRCWKNRKVPLFAFLKSRAFCSILASGRVILRSLSGQGNNCRISSMDSTRPRSVSRCRSSESNFRVPNGSSPSSLPRTSAGSSRAARSCAMLLKWANPPPPPSPPCDEDIGSLITLLTLPLRMSLFSLLLLGGSSSAAATTSPPLAWIGGRPESFFSRAGSGPGSNTCTRGDDSRLPNATKNSWYIHMPANDTTSMTRNAKTRDGRRRRAYNGRSSSIPLLRMRRRWAEGGMASKRMAMITASACGGGGRMMLTYQRRVDT